MSKRFELYLKSGERALKQLDNYMEVAKKVKRMVEDVWNESKVYVFGSVVDGRCTAMSDIDILIVIDGASREESYGVKAMIYHAIDAPMELHVISNEELESWYRRFVDRLEEVP